MFNKLRQIWDRTEQALVTYRENILANLTKENEIADFSGNSTVFKLYIDADKEKKTSAITISEALQRHNRLQILGAPGSGKTALLKHTALLAASGDFTNIPNLPILLKLAHYKSDSVLHALQEEVCRISKHNFHTDEIEHFLLQGRFIVLLDGLDENSDRDTLKEHINKFANLFPHTNFLVSSRPVAELQKNSFHKATIAPLTKNDIRKLTIYLCSRYKLDSYKLWLILDNNKLLLSLSQNPLLLRSVVEIYKSQGAIPTSITNLLESWLSTKYQFLSTEEKKKTLGAIYEIAFNLEKEEKNVFRIEDLQSQQLKSAGKWIDFKKELSSMCDNGILEETDKETYRFSHKIFQEYYASKATDLLGTKDLLRIFETDLDKNLRTNYIYFWANRSDTDELVSYLAKSSNLNLNLCAATLITEGAKTSRKTYEATILRLFASLGDQRTSLGFNTCDALIQLRSSDVLKYCKEELSKNHPDISVPVYYAYIIAMLGERNESAIEILFNAARNKDPFIRAQAYRALFATNLNSVLVFLIDRFISETDSKAIDEILSGLDGIDSLPDKLSSSSYGKLMAELEARSRNSDEKLREKILSLISKFATVTVSEGK